MCKAHKCWVKAPPIAIDRELEIDQCAAPLAAGGLLLLERLAVLRRLVAGVSTTPAPTTEEVLRLLLREPYSVCRLSRATTSPSSCTSTSNTCPTTQTLGVRLFCPCICICREGRGHAGWYSCTLARRYWARLGRTRTAKMSTMVVVILRRVNEVVSCSSRVVKLKVPSCPACTTLILMP